MVNKIEKFLARLTEKERQKIEEASDRILEDWRNAGDIKSLKGFKNVFRLRVGRFRIIF